MSETMGLDVRRWESTPEADEANIPEPYRRSSWGDGPWQNEPDLVEWRKPGSTLPRLMVRNSMGSWCGYVGVPEGHPYYGRKYSDVDANVHGGLTYANHCAGHICHVPAPGESDAIWWLGFDCGHGGDLTPGLGYLQRMTKRDGVYALANYGEVDYFGRFETYRDLAYVVCEVEALAEQLERNPAEMLEGESDQLKEQPTEAD